MLTEFDAFCEGWPRYNGFYGFGIVDALRAATAESEDDDELAPRRQRASEGPQGPSQFGSVAASG
jgi:hypothetical protein